ncbi:hypothetical protein DES40_2532 [Litorimonas taeanensis]|uniref:Uncharacterized protein n=1 Tax=Litorimonas taeanensis TaxID=568099 RepID=A0A420WFG3_9PROT|nr:hypothetical protein [Litorimonas taeanensis]RKQ69727.1 hypothetical protein DES40_2532 [Litorimonas taeanensis]
MTKQRSDGVKTDTWDNVEGTLHSKLSSADAWQMAQNLGFFVSEKKGSMSPQKFIRRIFESAYGDLAESKIKNRKRWVVLPEEVKGRTVRDLKNNDLAKSGGDFKRLAQSLGLSRVDSLAMLVKETTLEPAYLKVAILENSGFNLVENLCASISKKYNLVDYYKTLVTYGVSWKHLDPTATDEETIQRALPRINIDDDVKLKSYEKGELAQVNKYGWPVGFSLSGNKNNYDSLEEHLSFKYSMNDSDLIVLAPTVFLGNLFLPNPIFKVQYPKEVGLKNWEMEEPASWTEFSDSLKTQFSHFPFFEEPSEGIKIYDHDFKYEHCRKEYEGWSKLIKQQASDMKISFAAGYSFHRVYMSLLPSADGSEVIPHIIISGDHTIGGTYYSAFLPEKIKSYSFNGNRDIQFVDHGRIGFFALYDEAEWENDFSKFSPLIQTAFPLKSRSANSLFAHRCDKSGSWLKEVEVSDLYDNYNPVFHPSFQYSEETLVNSVEDSIIGKLHRHLLTIKPENCVLAILDEEAKLFTENLSYFLKDIRQKNSEIEDNLKSYFDRK